MTVKAINRPSYSGGPFFGKNLSLWPFSAIVSIVLQANYITALWPGPEPVSTDGALAAVDLFGPLAFFFSNY